MRGVTINKEQMGSWIIFWKALQKLFITIYPAIIGHLYEGILRSPEEPFCIHPLAFENNHCGSIPTSSIDAGQTGGGLTFLSTSDLKTGCPNFCNPPGGQEVILEPCFVAIPGSQSCPYTFQTTYSQQWGWTLLLLRLRAPLVCACSVWGFASETPETIYSQPFLWFDWSLLFLFFRQTERPVF